MVPASSIGFLVPVHDAFVPIIKMQLNEIEIDLIFAAIETLHTIPKNLSLNDNKLLEGMDQASIRAITGPRVTDEILSLIPEAKTFRTALRAVKLWAQRRAIYANIVGYPGGVAWAMLVARVCQLYPHAVGATIVHKFFFVMKDWKWPIPVMLKEIEQGNGKEKVWNPSIYPGDRKNIMPIITPAYPSMCATYNIAKSGKTIITRELERGSKITQEIFLGKGKWSDLFQKHTFFTKDHKYYLSVIASARDKEQVKAWGGMVESKIRILVGQLELLSDQISLARPFVKGFSRSHRVSDDNETLEVRKGSMKYQVSETKILENGNPELVANGDANGTSGADSPSAGGNFNTYTFYIGIDLTASAQKNLNISAAISYFKSVCHQWQPYDQSVHFLDAVPVKAHDLPDDLFDTKLGEAKPIKPVKKVYKQQKPLARSTDDAENLVSSDAKRQKTGTDTPTPAPTGTQTPQPAAA
jgi:poly(A) polymerase